MTNVSEKSSELIILCARSPRLTIQYCSSRGQERLLPYGCSCGVVSDVAGTMLWFGSSLEAGICFHFFPLSYEPGS